MIKQENILDCDQSNYSPFLPIFLQRCSLFHKSGETYSRDIFIQIFQDGRLLDLVQPEVEAHSIRWPVAEISPYEFSKMAASRHLGFDQNGIRAIRSDVPEHHTLEPNMKWIGWPIAEILPF